MAPQSLITKEKAREVAQIFKQALTNAGVQISSLYLFGSYAYGAPHAWSDVDIAVVSPQFGKDYIKESVLLNRIADGINSLIEAHPMSEADLSDKWSTLAQEVQEGELV